MTLEQENDFYILCYLNTKPSFTIEDVAIFLALLPLDTNLFLKSQLDKNFIKFKENNVLISKSGKFYLNWLTSEKLKENLDIKIKKSSLGNNKFQKIVTILSLFTAIIAVITPFAIRAVDRGDIKRIGIESPQIQQILQTQQRLQQELRLIQVQSQKDSSKR